MKSLFVALVVLAPAVHATTYLVPDDRQMIEASPAIIAGTVVDSTPRRSERGLIETVTTVRIEERLKGLNGAATVTVVHHGGRIGDEWMMQSGAPAFAKGERVLLFLRRRANGEWTTWTLALGVFRFRDGTLMRGEEIFGWDEHGAPHVERARAETAFLAFVRDAVRGRKRSPDYFAPAGATTSPVTTHATFTSGSYGNNSGNGPVRRRGNALTVSWRLIGTQPGLDLERAVDAGNAAWNQQSALIHYSRSPIPASGPQVAVDSEHRVIANDPLNEIEDAGVGATAYSRGSGTHSFNGETFHDIDHADIVVNDTIVGTGPSSQQFFESLLTHELGHTLGLRHANRGIANVPACAVPLDCCVRTVEGGNCRSVMNSGDLGDLIGLQYWDRKAIDCLFHANCVSTTACDPQEIFRQPQARTTTSGVPVALSVIAGGTPPLRYQWYAGNAGDTSTPTGTSSFQLLAGPSSTTSYWVRVTDPCGNHVDSDAAAITVTACPWLAVVSATATNDPDGRISLRATASGIGLEYEWFRGTTPGEGGQSLGARRSVNVDVTERTAFWVRVSNTCGRVAVSELVFAAPCGLPTIALQPESQTIAGGSSATLSAVLAASGGEVAWYRGLPPDKTAAIGTGASITVAPTSTTTYWGTVTNGCGEIPVRTVTVYVTQPNGPARGRSARH